MVSQMDFTPKYATVETWMFMTGMGRRNTYKQLGLGNLKAVKPNFHTTIKNITANQLLGR